MSADFVHLHVHSDYSLLDGACKIDALLDKCKAFDMPACALTDHGALFGAVEFYKAAKEKGIKPIIGCELYVSPTDRFDKSFRSAGAGSQHLLTLCRDVTGYHNLCKLSSAGYLEGFHYKPRVDDDLLYKHREGLMVSTSCLSGRVPRLLVNDDMDGADAAMRKYIEIFGADNYFVELMDHSIPNEEKVNPLLCELAEKHGLLVVATNDCHYIEQEDAEAHEALLCMQTGSTLEDEKHFRFQTNEFHFRSPDEMKARFEHYPSAITNTLAIAERCNLELPLGQHLIPEYVPPEGKAKEQYLRELVMQGLDERYGEPADEYVERAEHELSIIANMGFTDYFLVTWDLINHARQEGIPVGPGRGSGAGSLVAYALRITNIDPMRYKLLFERFLNPDRVSMPDFDIDFCYERRGEMIEYARNKYGRDNVAQIITFGRMLARNVVRSVGRVLGMPYSDVDRIAKLIPEELKMTLAKARGLEPEIDKLIQSDPQVAKLWDLAVRLESTVGNAGTHAAGVVICDQPLTDHVALFKAANSETVATQVEMKGVEEVGLLKMDFLGLRTLTVVHEAVRLIKEKRGIEIDIDELEPDDEKAYALLRSGHTTGVFQLESAGMRDVAKRIGLESLEEINALVALYRPGPRDYIDTYIQGKFHPESVHYDHELLRPILEETYGIAVFQEQIMQMVQAVAGFSLGQADILRRAMSKKKAGLMEEQRTEFAKGCKARGIDGNLINVLWEKIATFAGYGFNKSHSTAYAYVAYQTAFLKANYPVAFMCALLTSERGSLEKIALYVDECRQLGIEVLPPDINHSETVFSVEGDAIRFGMGAIKNVGEGPAAVIVAERNENGPFDDIFDFCARCDTRMVNKRLIESLNKAGAFASTGWNRHQVEAAIDSALSEGQITQREKASGQTSLLELLGDDDGGKAMHDKPNLVEWQETELLQYEKEVMGLFVSGHPLMRYQVILDRFATLHLADLPEKQEGEEVIAGGLLTQVKQHMGNRGQMAFATLETLEGNVEMTIFPDVYEQKKGLIVPDMIVMVKAKVNFRKNAPGLIVLDVMPIEHAERELTTAVHVRLAETAIENGTLDRVANILGKRQGMCDVYLHCANATVGEVIIHATSACQVAATRALRSELEALLGEDNVWFSAGMGLPTHTPAEPIKKDDPPWKRRRASAQNN
ncbi:MAG: DNA polymerase III subunit alpha [Candidatus Hydrogenedentota bacterium]